MKNHIYNISYQNTQHYIIYGIHECDKSIKHIKRIKKVCDTG